jgi:hypothetical protein
MAKLLKLPLLYLVLLASAVQVLSYPLLGTLSEFLSISASQYVYQIIAGFGCGINITLLVVMTPLTVEKRDNGKYCITHVPCSYLVFDA